MPCKWRFLKEKRKLRFQWKSIDMTWCHVRPFEGETFFGGGLQLYRVLIAPATLAPQEFPDGMRHKKLGR